MQQPTFRGKEKQTGEWVYGFGWLKTDYTKEYLEEIGQTTQDAVLYTKSGTILCELDTMGKSTEQRDTENNELFEGDICFFTPTLVENQATFRGVIIWDKTRFAIQNLDYDPKDVRSTPLVALDLFGVNARMFNTIHD